MNTAPQHRAPQSEAIAAMDQAIDRLASTEAQALAAHGVLEATVRQLVASIQSDDAPARTAGIVSDTLQALALALQALAIYQDAADDVVVTAGAAIGDMECPHPEPAPIAGHAPAPAASALAAFDAALAALLHTASGIETLLHAFDGQFEQRFAESPEHLTWVRPKLLNLFHRVSGKSELIDRADCLVTAAADVFDGLGLRWRDGYGLTDDAVAHSGGIFDAFLDAYDHQAPHVLGIGG